MKPSKGPHVAREPRFGHPFHHWVVESR